jgi:hypothetical protein
MLVYFGVALQYTKPDGKNKGKKKHDKSPWMKDIPKMQGRTWVPPCCL